MTAGSIAPTPSRRARTAERLAQAVRAGIVSDDRLCSIVGALRDTLGTEHAQISVLSDRQIPIAFDGMSAVECATSTDPLATLVAPAEDTLCAVAVRSGVQLPIDDATLDERVASSPGVTLGIIGSYLGSPIRLPAGPDDDRQGDMTIGVLCTYSSTPRAWTARECEAVDRAATDVARELGTIRDSLDAAS